MQRFVLTLARLEQSACFEARLEEEGEGTLRREEGAVEEEAVGTSQTEERYRRHDEAGVFVRCTHRNWRR